MVTTNRLGAARLGPCLPKPLCDNPQQASLNMQSHTKAFLCLLGAVLASACAWPQAGFPVASNAPASIPLVLVGGTLVDVTNWGHSARDLQDSVVVVHEGRIVEVGLLGVVSIPKGARVIDCKGKFILPGLVDGFAGMNSQGQANANLYMGVTTVVARNDHQPQHRKRYLMYQPSLMNKGWSICYRPYL